MEDYKPIEGPVYFTRYWESVGIIVLPGGEVSENGKYFVYDDKASGLHYFASSRDWTKDRDEALSRVKAKARKKAGALQKKLAALQDVDNGNVKFVSMGKGE